MKKRTRLSPYIKTALEFPLRDVNDYAEAKYRHYIRLGDRRGMICLYLSLFPRVENDPRPYWHVTVFLIKKEKEGYDRALSYVEYSDDQIEAMMRTCKNALADVGDDSDAFFEAGSVGVHLFKPLTQKEMEQFPDVSVVPTTEKTADNLSSPPDAE